MGIRTIEDCLENNPNIHYPKRKSKMENGKQFIHILKASNVHIPSIENVSENENDNMSNNDIEGITTIELEAPEKVMIMMNLPEG